MSADPVGIIGFRVITDINMTVHYEDWSRVRSPGRAARRLKRGFRQNIVHLQVPSPKVINLGDTLIMHPKMLEAMRRRVEGRNG